MQMHSWLVWWPIKDDACWQERSNLSGTLIVKMDIMLKKYQNQILSWTQQENRFCTFKCLFNVSESIRLHYKQFLRFYRFVVIFKKK